MRRIHSTDTAPEIAVRSALHRLGYRFRLHEKKLPGRPDLVFPSRRKAIFVHGCFWHQHAGCIDGRMPRARRDYWEPKLTGNRMRDRRNRRKLRQLGWESLIVWECATGDMKRLMPKLQRFLENQGRRDSGRQ